MSSWLKLFYPYRRLRLTREGWILSALSLSIGLIAINTGHNLFYLVFGLLLGLVIVSGILSERVLRGAVAARRVPSELTARVPFAVILEVSNSHQQRIAYSLMVRDTGSFFEPRTLGYIAVLRPGEVKSFYYLVQAERRGSHRFGPVELVTRFPFGLFEKTRIIPACQETIVFPGRREAPSISAVASGKEQTGYRKRHWGEEILGLRPAAAEDDHRSIHWRTSARMGRLMVKEFVEEIERPRSVFFDSRGEDGEAFEQAVEVTATLLRMLAGRGVPVVLATWEEYLESTTPGGQLEALRLLALLSPSRGMEGKGFEHWRRETLRDGGGIYLQRDGATPPATLPPCEVVRL